MKKTSQIFICIAALALLSCNGGGNDPNEHYPLMIADNVQKWKEEQLASKSNEKKLINISDMYLDGSKCRRDLDIPGEILSSPENCRNWVALMTAEELTELLSKKYDNLLIEFLQEQWYGPGQWYGPVMPVMDSRVVAFYSHVINNGNVNWLSTKPSDFYNLGNFDGVGISIATYENGSFDNERAECNYFGIFFSYTSARSEYWILSQDMVLHQIKPGKPGAFGGCVANQVPVSGAMLVCDDTAEGNLKDKIDFNSIQSLTDPNWTCNTVWPYQ